MDEAEFSGHLALKTASTQSQTSKGPRETPHLEEGDTSILCTSEGLKKDELPSEQIKLKHIKYDQNDFSEQTRMVFLEESSYYRSSGEVAVPPPQSQDSNLTISHSLVCSHTATQTPGDHEAREASIPSPQSSDLNTESDPMQPCPLLVQSMDCLPTFTSHRPPNIPTTMGKLPLSNTWNVSNTPQYENR